MKGLVRKLPVGIVVLAFAVGPWQILTDRGSDPAPGFRPAEYVMSTDDVIAMWGRRVERNGSDFVSLTYLGEAFIRKARESGDPAYYRKAEQALTGAVERRPSYVPAVANLGVVRLVQHDWLGALDLAQRARFLDPSSLQALGTLGDVHLERGAYDDADAAYRELAARSEAPPVISRLARMAWLRGRTADAIALATTAAEQSGPLPGPGRDASWHRTQLAELLFDAGKVEAATEEYERVLRGDPSYHFALAGLGHIRAVEGRLEEAVELYSRAVAIVPEPDLLAALGDLQMATGRAQEAGRQYDTVVAVALGDASGSMYRRDLSLFYADRNREPEKAVALAAAEIEARQDVYTWDAYAWALYKAGRFTEAAEAADRALALGTQDASVLYHAGMVHDSLQSRDRARELLSRALATNPVFDFRHAPLAARALERLGTA